MPASDTAPPFGSPPSGRHTLVRRVVLCTDFGPGSAYVGQMKLVIDAMAPGVTILDLAHDLPPHDPTAAALILAGAWRFLPGRTVLVAVVDPGVGSSRRICAIHGKQDIVTLVPDNGLARTVAELCDGTVVNISLEAASASESVSPVFHGRDVFAPIAARLALGSDPSVLGPSIGLDTLLPLPRPLIQPPEQGIEVVYVDSFGNLVTSLRERPGGASALIAMGHRVPFVDYYAQAPSGSLVALVGSFGHVEVAVTGGSAAERLGAGIGQRFALAPSRRPE